LHRRKKPHPDRLGNESDIRIGSSLLTRPWQAKVET
jgi:hypothetical protein